MPFTPDVFSPVPSSAKGCSVGAASWQGWPHALLELHHRPAYLGALQTHMNTWNGARPGGGSGRACGPLAPCLPGGPPWSCPLKAPAAGGVYLGRVNWRPQQLGASTLADSDGPPTGTTPQPPSPQVCTFPELKCFFRPGIGFKYLIFVPKSI